MAHGHGLKGRLLERMVYWVEVGKGGKSGKNCNSMINEIYLKNKNKTYVYKIIKSNKQSESVRSQLHLLPPATKFVLY